MCYIYWFHIYLIIIMQKARQGPCIHDYNYIIITSKWKNSLI